jgi:hypothetical protein
MNTSMENHRDMAAAMSLEDQAWATRGAAAARISAIAVQVMERARRLVRKRISEKYGGMMGSTM